VLLASLIALIAESYWWTRRHELPVDAMVMQQRFRLGYAPIPKLEPIPAGDFDMGEQDQGFLRTVSEEDWQYLGVPGKHIEVAEAFELGRYEVTYEEFDYYVWEQQRAGRAAVKYPTTAKGGRGRQPVVNIDWNEAMAYAGWLGERKGLECRLPTEAEWEYAARAGTSTAYPWGDDVRQESQGAKRAMANCDGCGSPWDGEQSAPVGRFPPNRFGLHDTSGNVYEWTCSLWREQFDGSEEGCADGDDPALRVLRGGSWGGSQASARSAFRYWSVPNARNDNVGFRVLCSSPIIDH
jgi:formylglycine-generating enzyme required for sulfatase activity